MRLLLLAALLCASAEAAVVQVHAPEDCRGQVIARAATSEVRTPFAGEAEINLPEGQTWRVRAEAAACWSPTIEVSGAAADLALLPVTTLRGRSFGVNAILMRVSGDAIPATDDRCEIRGEQFECRVPAAKIDLRLVAEGFIPHYFWDLQMPADLGEIRWQHGPSVIGWTSKPATVRLTADGVLIATAAANARGFFQFTAVEPRRYTLEAIASDHASVKREGIEIAEPRENEVKPKLILQPPAAVEVFVVPPVDAENHPWTIRLSNYVNPTAFTPVAEGKASPAGVWSTRGLRAGEYRVDVVNAAGSVFHRMDVEVTPGMPPIHIAISRISIRGNVTVGGDPLACSLQFQSGHAHVKVDTDDQGAYHADLPEEGAWDVSVSPAKAKVMLRHHKVEVHRAAGESVTTVNIVLRGGTIAGEVVDAETGRGIAANVVLMREDGRVEGFGASDDDGKFEYPGIREGRVNVSAESHDGDSGLVPCLVTEGEKVTVRVPVERSVMFDFSLVMRDGTPVAGAIIYLLSPSFMERREAVSAPSGHVSVDLPHSTTKVDMAIIAPGLPVKVLTLPIVNGRFPMRTLTIDENGGQLVVRIAGGWPFVSRDGSGFIALPWLSSPARMRQAMRPDGFTVWVEPGRYALCPEPKASEQCTEAVVSAGATVIADARRNR